MYAIYNKLSGRVISRFDGQENQIGSVYDLNLFDYIATNDQELNGDPNEYIVEKGLILRRDINEIINEIEEKNPISKQINMQDTNIKLLEEQTKVDLNKAKKESEIKSKIDSGEITLDNFSTLPLVDQEFVKLVLFKEYSPTQEQIPKALSAIEFILIPIVKLMDKTMDKSKLTTNELTFLNSLATLINKNDMPIDDTTDWRFKYLESEFTKVQSNRENYFMKKSSITGEI